MSGEIGCTRSAIVTGRIGYSLQRCAISLFPRCLGSDTFNRAQETVRSIPSRQRRRTTSMRSSRLISQAGPNQLRWKQATTFKQTNWSGQEIPMSFTQPGHRPKPTHLRPVSLETFRLQFNPMVVVFMETDRACSGNPGPEGWGYILSQQGVYTSAYGGTHGTR
jgi:hypothetical protein